MDQNQFDSVARSIGTPATRRSGIKALVGGLLGLGGAASVLSADAKKKRFRGVPCNGSRCGRGQLCFNNECLCKDTGNPPLLGHCVDTLGFEGTCLPYDGACGTGCGRVTCADDSKCCSGNCTNAGDTGFPFYTVYWRCRD